MKSENVKTINLVQLVGSFAENKDTAKKVRTEYILPALQNNKKIILDFKGVDSATQSFTHALISDLIRKFGDDFFECVSFKNCNDTVKRVIGIVAEYMQQDLASST